MKLFFLILLAHKSQFPRKALYGQSEVEEVPMKIYCISSVTENIAMEVPQKIPVYTFSVTLAYNGISIIIF